MGPVEGQGISIEDLPVEMMVEIFSNLNKTEKTKVSMVNKRWFGIANSEIKMLSIKWPQEKNFWKFCKSFWKFDSGQLLNESQDFINLIGRFERLKNLELTVNGLISQSWFFVQIIRSLLSMPYLKQIALDVAFDPLIFIDELDIEEEFPKNWNVEKITFDLMFQSLSFKVWNKLFNALPNIKQVKVVAFGYEKLPVFLKDISVLKNLKSLNLQIYGRDGNEKFDAQNFGHLLEIKNGLTIIKNNFPMNSEVVIADMCWMDDSRDYYLTNLIEKESGKNPKIVI